MSKAMSKELRHYLGIRLWSERCRLYNLFLAGWSASDIRAMPRLKRKLLNSTISKYHARYMADMLRVAEERADLLE